MCRAAPPAADPADFTHKIVRDLHWVLTSPHLLAPNAIVPTLPDEQAARIAARSHSWLAALDADPSPLLEFLQSQRNVRRLGFYFASLLEFWVRASPAIGVTDAERQLLVQQQVHEGLGGAVLGELKCVFAPSSADVRHWESHIKFFAFAGTPAADGGQADGDAAHRRLGSYVGPFLGENLLHRVLELQRKLAITDAPNVRSFLGRRFGRPQPLTAVRQESVLRGWLFYPLGSARDASAGAPLSARHLRGWWTRSLDDALAAFPGSMWAEPGSAIREAKDGGKELHCAAGSGQLRWLAPAFPSVMPGWSKPSSVSHWINRRRDQIGSHARFPRLRNAMLWTMFASWFPCITG